jgi:molecular chaperone GrpE
MSVRDDEEPPRIIDRRASQQPESEPKGEPEEKTTQDNPATLEAQLAQEKERAESYYASWQRAAADYQNFKRRVEQERSEIAQMANVAMLINLLPLVDDLERALENVDAHLAGLTWLDGVRLIYRKFQALLEMNGVTEIPAEGQAFDPKVHEAVMYTDGDEGKVLNVVQKGYMLGGRTLRPAMVVVGNGGKKEAEG